MKMLIIRHIDRSEPAQFEVVRLLDGKSVGPATVPSPVGFPVEDRPNSDLTRELRWYLETFLDYPFPPETDHAQRVRDALNAWREQAFAALFGDRAACSTPPPARSMARLLRRISRSSILVGNGRRITSGFTRPASRQHAYPADHGYMVPA